MVYGVDDFFRRFPLHDVAARAGADGALRVNALVMHREHDHRDIREQRTDRTDKIDAGAVSQRKIDDRKIGPRTRDRLQGGFRILSFAKNNKIVGDRKSTRLNSSHANISYAVFCLKKKTIRQFASQLLVLLD